MQDDWNVAVKKKTTFKPAAQPTNKAWNSAVKDVVGLMLGGGLLLICTIYSYLPALLSIVHISTGKAGAAAIRLC